MSNTFDSALVNSVLAQKGISVLRHKLSWLKAFSTDFSDEVRDQRSRTINVPVYTATSAVQTNPTNFETGDTTATNAAVALNHISKSFYITSADYGKGTRLESLAEINMNVVAKAIEDAVFAKITEANYGTAVVTGITPGAMSEANLKTLWGAVGGTNKACVLADSEFKNFIGTNLTSFDVLGSTGAYGFDTFDHSGAGFASAGTKIVGFGATKGALAIASAIPEYSGPVADMLSSEVFEVPDLGLAVQFNVWGSTASRNTWGSFDVLFGAAVGDASQAKLVKTV
ncbi:hypothetical protein [Haloferula sp. BvORR071]|uniref:hypothetical protein n=1 Tax=Haloferula sp. BvORR071 TaxID=1396141 RepID=UPI00054E380E|nr:hypothetical protein [Haloferula sp. BvORR071]